MLQLPFEQDVFFITLAKVTLIIKSQKLHQARCWGKKPVLLYKEAFNRTDAS